MIQEAEAALASGRGVAAVGRGAAGASAGATLAGVVAFITVLLWSTNDTPGSSAEQADIRQHDFESQLEPEPEVKTEPMSKTPVPDQTTTENRRRNHRANIHVQGDDMKTIPNAAFSQNVPITKVQGHAGLETVKAQCTPRQLRFRQIAFKKAWEFIRKTVHTAPPELFRSFRNPEVIGDPDKSSRRVDIEIIEGTAFV